MIHDNNTTYEQRIAELEAEGMTTSDAQGVADAEIRKKKMLATMFAVIINPIELEAVSLAASKEETRYYMNGVYVENYEGGHALIATDGHRMHSIGIRPIEAAKGGFILGNDDIKKALSMAKAEKLPKHSSDAVRIRIDADELKISIKIIVVDKEGDSVRECGSFTSKAIDGTFPDYRRLIPAISEAAVGCLLSFNAAYIADFGKAAKLLSSPRSQIKITSSGIHNPVLIELPCCESFTGVLMPMRF